MVFARGMWGVVLACVLAAGCQGNTPAAKSTDGDVASDDGAGANGQKVPGQEAVKPPMPVLENVDSFEGSWVLTPYMSRRNVNFWLLRLTPDENGGWTMTSQASEPLLGEFKPVDVKIDGDKIRLDAQIENPKAQIKSAKLSFEGKLSGGEVKGNLQLSGSAGLMPCRLVPTDADNLNDYQDSSLSEGARDFDKVLSEPDPARGMLKQSKSMPNSPLSLDGYGFVFGQIYQWNLTDDEIRTAVEDFTAAIERWGSRLQGYSEVNVAMQLARARKSIDLAEELLNAGEARLEDKAQLKTLLEAARLNLRIAHALRSVVGKEEAAAAKAWDELQELLKDHPYHPELLLASAEYGEKHEKADAAIANYLTIVALPMMQRLVLATRIGLAPGDPTPRSALEYLWKEKHGSLDGLDAALAETYASQIDDVLAAARTKTDPFPAADAGNRTVLTEVFTGTACEPCVAADLAVDILVRDLPPEESIVLNYHQHIPAGDPLTSADCEERGSYYSVQGTPFVIVNGVAPVNIGGTFVPEAIQESYRLLRTRIDFFLKTSTEIVIEPKANVEDGKLTVDVAVTGVPEAELSNVRLRLAIVEDEVAFQAPNGIRRHPMVVRTMLGGARGIAARQGELKYNLSMPVAELKARQMAYLLTYEQGKRLQFPERPVEFKPLRLVAFVQHEQNKEVLQAASTPIAGEIAYPEELVFPTQQEIEAAEKARGGAPETKPAPDKPADPSEK